VGDCGVNDGLIRPSYVQGHCHRGGAAWDHFLPHVNISVQSSAGAELTIMVNDRLWISDVVTLLVIGTEVERFVSGSKVTPEPLVVTREPFRHCL
jgi:hypothetical protein